jgi:hypothetical protein
MTSKLIRKYFLSLVIILSITSIAGCKALIHEQTSSVTNGTTTIPTDIPNLTAIPTITPTKTPNPTATFTYTPEPSPTVTVSPNFAMSVDSQSALSMSNECRAVVNGLNNLKFSNI